MDEIVPIRRALLSVSDKRGLVELARVLAARGVHLLASGGTRTALVEAGLDVTEVSSHTGQPEILGGRVKTLHPKLHGGILARRDVPGDLQALEAQGIEPIDLVVVNLYPFEATVARPGVTFEEAVENIDIGGPSLVRGAAKNHAHVAVLTSPDQYPTLIEQLETIGGTTLAFRKALALAVFEQSSRYDRAIADYLAKATAAAEGEAEAFPPRLSPSFERRSVLRYGENPHQRAAFYVEPGTTGPNLATAKILHGKELSYNNLLDLDGALRLIRLFAEPAATILKHNNPCGAAEAESLAEAFELAYEGDPVSAFGGIVGLNRTVDRATAERLCVPRPVHRGDPRPGVRARRRQAPDHEADLEEQRPAAGPGGPNRSRDAESGRVRPPPGRGGAARPGLGRDGARPRLGHRPHETVADGRGTRGAGLRLAGLPGGEVERDRADQGPPAHRRGGPVR